MRQSSSPYWKHWRVSDHYHDGLAVGKAKLRMHVATGLEALRAAFNGSGTFSEGDRAIGLLLNGQLQMSDSKDEFIDHLAAIRSASGRVLVHGLGLGCYLHCILSKPEVEHVDVVEISEDVLRLITPYFRTHNGRVTFHHDDAFTRKWPKGLHWNYAWHDIWPTICTDDLQQHALLQRRFARRVDSQDCWKHDWLISARRRGM